ncbi:MAG: DEAD/DEAH box helicase [Thermodesulfovibrionales bacterium]
MEVERISVDPRRWEPASRFPLHPLQYERLNPVQSAFFDYYDKEANVIVEASTSAGKTVIAEMAIARALAQGGKAVYLCPAKDLARQQTDEWTGSRHPFSARKVVIATGEVTQEMGKQTLIRELHASDIAIMTNELFDSLFRRSGSEELAAWKGALHTVVIDEFHYLDEAGRGSALECALIRTVETNRNLRYVGLSATMGNAEEVARWLRSLTGRETILLSSSWRPCVLNLSLVPYRAKGARDKQVEFLALIKYLLDRFPDDKFLIFVHTKGALAKTLLGGLKAMGYEIRFHNADKTMDVRNLIVESFKKREGGLQDLLATSTVAVGMNLPARRVIVVDVYRGRERVDVKQLNQMVGRAGRTGIDPEGDAYLIVPQEEFTYWASALSAPSPVLSQLRNPKELMFHLVSDISNGAATAEALEGWFMKTLACFQSPAAAEDAVRDALGRLLKCGAVEQENGVHTATGIGKMASWYYYAPETVSFIVRGLSAYSGKSDVVLSWVLGRAYLFNKGGTIYHSSVDFTRYVDELKIKTSENERLLRMSPPAFNNAVYAYGFYLWLNELFETAGTEMTGVVRELLQDMQRLAQLLDTAADFYGKALGGARVKKLAYRLRYGIRSELYELCRIKGIGAKRARLLFNSGFRTVEDIKKDITRASNIARVSLQGLAANG